MGHMQSDRKQQKPCNGMAALYRASQQEMGTPALDISDTVDIDIVCHISILASTSQQIASNMRFLVIHYTVLMFDLAGFVCEEMVRFMNSRQLTKWTGQRGSKILKKYRQTKTDSLLHNHSDSFVKITVYCRLINVNYVK